MNTEKLTDEEMRATMVKVLRGRSLPEVTRVLVNLLAGVIKLRLAAPNPPTLEEAAETFKQGVLLTCREIPEPPAVELSREPIDAIPVQVIDESRQRALEAKGAHILIELVREGHTSEEISNIVEYAAVNMVLSLHSPEISTKSAADAFCRNVAAILGAVERANPPS